VACTDQLNAGEYDATDQGYCENNAGERCRAWAGFGR
jgi:hypothetical protein